jgi:hypothetical protein
MGYIKEYKDYKILRNSWWKFWEVDVLEFQLPTRYEDAYEEVEKKLINGSQISIELRSWVIEDVREQLVTRIVTYGKLAKKAKKLKVKFSTSDYYQFYKDGMNFHLRGDEIYFDTDDAIKREKLLNQILSVSL